jgi:hypothetical protein
MCGCKRVGEQWSVCENIHSWISLSGDLAFYHQDEFMVLNPPKGFWRSLTEGVVHMYVGQKLLKPYILRVFWLTDYKLFHATFD